MYIYIYMLYIHVYHWHIMYMYGKIAMFCIILRFDPQVVAPPDNPLMGRDHGLLVGTHHQTWLGATISWDF